MHELDRRRFLAYAIRCAKKDKYIDTKAMLEHGVSAETVEELECIFEWIRSTVDYLTCKG